MKNYQNQPLCTKIKFTRSEVNNSLIGFVSQNTINHVLCGVRADSPYPKKIVIVHTKIAHDIIPNALYNCRLEPMAPQINPKTGEAYIPGYIAVEADLVQFKAKVELGYIKGVQYMVEVKFGNKTVRFDPFRGKKESVKSFEACKAVLEKRCDVVDIVGVVTEFEKSCNLIMKFLKRDMKEMNGYRYSKR